MPKDQQRLAAQLLDHVGLDPEARRVGIGTGGVLEMMAAAREARASARPLVAERGQGRCERLARTCTPADIDQVMMTDEEADPPAIAELAEAGAGDHGPTPPAGAQPARLCSTRQIRHRSCCLVRDHALASRGERGESEMARSLVAATLTTAALMVVGCAGSSNGKAAEGSSSGPFAPREKVAAAIKGQQISVLLPYQLPKSFLSDFTAKTGVKVNLTVTGWDAVHSKLIVANTAKTYIADVTEFDWSFTGQFAASGWDEPLEKALDPALLADLKTADSAFVADGHTFAACYTNDFRISLYNDEMFKKAGLPTYPATFADLGPAIRKLKAAGVQYPLLIPMAATEGGVTPWYLLTLAMGGQLFGEHFKPQFAEPGSAGYKALQFEVDAVKNGWVSPGSVTLDAIPSLDKFNAGAGAILFAASPSNLPISNDPKESAIAGHAKGGLVPGESGPGATFGLPEGLAIPVTAKHKDAARAFIEFWMQPENQRMLYEQAGMLPCRKSVLTDMSASGEIEGSHVVGEEFAHVHALFPQGAPKWYSKFSSEAQGLLNAAVKGNMSVGDALKQLSDKATELAAGGS
jgi:multiple sugar transport system substrate-binding protein